MTKRRRANWKKVPLDDAREKCAAAVVQKTAAEDAGSNSYVKVSSRTMDVLLLKPGPPTAVAEKDGGGPAAKPGASRQPE